MTNPNNAVRVSSRNGGRGSVYEANAWAQAYGNGILTGNGVTPSTGMTIAVGGTTACPDVVIATNASGYKIGLDLVDSATVTVSKPASNKKIVAIVAYTNDLAVASTESNITGNPASCGLIAVDGTVSANPVDPTDAQIRTAITSDGGTGPSAAYGIIGTILLTSSTSSITSGIITRRSAVSGLIDIFYPIGAYYETSDTSFDPNIAWGGTWVEDTAGRVTVATNNGTFPTVGGTGGAETHTHDLSTGWAQMIIKGDGRILYNEKTLTPTNYWTANYKIEGSNPGSATDSGQAYGPTLGGNSASSSTLQPYIVVKRWHRTA